MGNVLPFWTRVSKSLWTDARTDTASSPPALKFHYLFKSAIATCVHLNWPETCSYWYEVRQQFDFCPIFFFTQSFNCSFLSWFQSWFSFNVFVIVHSIQLAAVTLQLCLQYHPEQESILYWLILEHCPSSHILSAYLSYHLTFWSTSAFPTITTSTGSQSDLLSFQQLQKILSWPFGGWK